VTEIAVIVPVLQRPHRAQPLIDSLTAATPDGVARPVFVCTPDDVEEIQACNATGADVIVTDWPAGKADWARKAELARSRSDEQFMLLGADDITFQPGWAEAVLAMFDGYDVGVVGTNDCANPTVMRGLHSTHPVVCRGYADTHGTVDRPDLMLPDCYHHNWVDAELVETAKARGCWAFAADARVPHSNPIWGTAELDATYLKGREHYSEDAALFRSRQLLWQRVAA
jgi:hypothetical protein